MNRESSRALWRLPMSPICPCNTLLRYDPAICSRDMLLRYTPAVYLCSVLLRYTPRAARAAQEEGGKRCEIDWKDNMILSEACALKQNSSYSRGIPRISPAKCVFADPSTCMRAAGNGARELMEQHNGSRRTREQLSSLALDKRRWIDGGCGGGGGGGGGRRGGGPREQSAIRGI
jgi:hypothetical protein